MPRAGQGHLSWGLLVLSYHRSEQREVGAPPGKAPLGTQPSPSDIENHGEVLRHRQRSTAPAEPLQLRRQERAAPSPKPPPRWVQSLPWCLGPPVPLIAVTAGEGWGQAGATGLRALRGRRWTPGWGEAGGYSRAPLLPSQLHWGHGHRLMVHRGVYSRGVRDAEALGEALEDQGMSWWDAGGFLHLLVSR